MSWLGRILRPDGAAEVRTLQLRTTRFRQLLRRYGRMLDLEADAADKQGGDYVLDRGYVTTLIETVFESAEAVVFDLNVMSGGQYEDLHDAVDRLHEKVRGLAAECRLPESGGEEPEYLLLRQVRRALFATQPEDGPAHLEDCRTVREVVHLAHELAGEVLLDLLAERLPSQGVMLTGARGLRAVDLGGGLAEDELDGARELLSLPMKALLRGLELCDPTGAGSVPPESILPLVTEEHATVSFRSAYGSELIDSFLGAGRESNYLYGRFASEGDKPGPRRPRGRFAREVLTRLDFAIVRTPRSLSAWIGGLPQVDLEERPEIAGRLVSELHEGDAGGWAESRVEQQVSKFMAQYT